MARFKISFKSKKGRAAEEAIKKANDKLKREMLVQARRKVLIATIFLEGEIKRAIKNYPLVDTGRLVNSISHNVRKKNNEPIIRGKVGSTIKKPKYPIFLEFGTSKMAPKPFVRPTFNKNKEQIIKIISSGVKVGIKKGT